MIPYNNSYAPPLTSDESYFNYALLSHVKFAIAVLVMLLLLLILLWNSQPWFKIKIERSNHAPQEITQSPNRENLNLALESNVEWVAYRVLPGETLSEIATRYGVGLSVLRKHNGIDDPNAIRSGQRLKIPQRRNQ
jgi:LysM domain